MMTDSQDWWPADYGHYGPLFIRHDLARRRHLPHRRRTRRRRRAARSASRRSTAGPTTPTSTRPAGCSGRSSRSTARRSRGPTCSSSPATSRWSRWASRRSASASAATDVWEPEEIFWGPEDDVARRRALQRRPRARRPARRRADGPDLREPRRARTATRTRSPSARDIRETFARMAMNDEETVALIAGGHTFGKCHGAGDRRPRRSRARGLPRRAQGLGWTNTFGTGKGADTITSGLEGAWTNDPTQWDNGFFDNLFGYEWELTKSPAGAQQWTPKNPEAQDTVPDAHDPSKRHAPMMLTTDLALRLDPIYEPISKRFHENPDQLADRVRQGLVQAAAPRHGPRLALPRPVGPRAAAVAGPGPGGRPRAGRRRRTSPRSRPRSSTRACRSPQLVSHRVGVGVHLPRHRQAGRRQRRPHPPRAAEGLGGQRAGRAGEGAADPRGDPAGLQRLAAGRRSRWPT